MFANLQMAVLFVTTVPVWGNEGRLRVAVTDSAGAAVQGALVTVGEQRGKTDASGVASFAGLPVGHIEVATEKRGFKTWRRTYDVVNGQELLVDARLKGMVLGGVLVSAAPLDGGGKLRVLVRDITQAAIIDAEVSLSCGGGVSRMARADKGGAAAFPDLPAGECRVEVASPKFKMWRGVQVVKGGTEAGLEAFLEVNDPGTKIAVRPSAGGRFIDWLTTCTRK